MSIEEYTACGYPEPGLPPAETEALLALAEEVVHRLTCGKSCGLLYGGDPEKARLVVNAVAAQCFSFLSGGSEGFPTVCRRTLFLLERAGIFPG